MLVPEPLVKSWYRPESKVYQNFRYLFQNPLWNTRMPKGMPVCPLFWLSLFSMFVLRPLIVVITKFLMPLVKLGGRPLAAADKRLREFVPEPFGSATGTGLGALIIVPFACFAVLKAVGVWFSLLHAIPNFSAKLSYIEGSAGLGVIFIGVIYYGKWQKASDNFLRNLGLAILSITLAFNAVLYWKALVGAGWAVLGFAGWVLKMLGVFVWTGLAWSPYFNVPWWIALGIVFGLCYLLLNKLFDVAYQAEQEPVTRDYTADWEHFIYHGFFCKGHYVAIRAWSQVSDHQTCFRYLVDSLARAVCREEAKQLAKQFKTVKFQPIERFSYKNYSWDTYKAFLGSQLYNRYDESLIDPLLSMSLTGLTTRVVNQYNEDPWVKQKREELKANQTRFEARTKVFCEVVDTLSKVVGTLSKPILQVGGSGCKIAATFFSYLWILAKSFKNKNCPFFYFEEK